MKKYLSPRWITPLFITGLFLTETVFALPVCRNHCRSDDFDNIINDKCEMRNFLKNPGGEDDHLLDQGARHRPVQEATDGAAACDDLVIGLVGGVLRH